MENVDLTIRSAVVLMLGAASAYLAVGVVFALAFHGWGLARLDPAAAGSTWGFRVLITPGVVLLWPYLAWRWKASKNEASVDPARSPRISDRPSPRQLRTTHRWMWRILAVLVPILWVMAMAYRPRPVVLDVDAGARVGQTRP